MILGDAADERLIPANPIRRQRRGRRHHDTVTEAVWVTPEQALRVALNAARLTTPDLGLLLVTAAWTGARWGELTGLHRDNLHLHPDGTGCLVIDPRVGALHEVDRQLYLGPPKTAESARTIALPPFLVALLRQHLHTHPHDHVFVTPDGAFLRRSNFARRAMRPAADGTTHHPQPPHRGRAGRPRVDLPRAAAQPQNLAHRRRHPRRRPSPTPRPPHPRQDPTHLQPRRPRTRNPAARRPATALDHRPRRRQPVLDNPDLDQPDPGHTNLDELDLSELDAAGHAPARPATEHRHQRTSRVVNPAEPSPDPTPPSRPPVTPPNPPQSDAPEPVRGHRRGRGRRTAGGVPWLPPTPPWRDPRCIRPRTITALLMLNLVLTIAVLVILLTAT